MNRDDIIRMAHEADCLDDQHYGTVWANKLERFAALVAAAEREACAQICYARCPMDGTVSVEVELARAIRARGEK
jgi:hypothetical protein